MSLSNPHPLFQNRSVSLFLRNCHVVFLVEYGVSTLQIAARGRHCHGRAVHVQAIRVFATNKLEKGDMIGEDYWGFGIDVECMPRRSDVAFHCTLASIV